jgi:hypothetical protein
MVYWLRRSSPTQRISREHGLAHNGPAFRVLMKYPGWIRGIDPPQAFP